MCGATEEALVLADVQLLQMSKPVCNSRNACEMRCAQSLLQLHKSELGSFHHAH